MAPGSIFSLDRARRKPSLRQTGGVKPLVTGRRSPTAPATTVAIRTYDGRRVVIPNAHLVMDTVVVNTASEHCRLEYDIGIGYRDDVERARGVILDTVRSTGGPFRRADAVDARDKVLTGAKHQLTAHGINLPMHQILFRYQTEDSGGGRSRLCEGWPAGNADAQIPKCQPRRVDGE